MKKSFLKIVNLNKTYFVDENEKIDALKNINLDLPSTGLVFLLGETGSGKSTLLNTIAALDKPTSGEIFFNNQSIYSMKEKQRDRYRGKYVGYVFQECNLLDELTVEENLQFSDDNYSKAKVLPILKEVGLENFLTKKVTDMSGGEKQRVVIARALLKQPKIIIADEPTASLDNDNSENIFKILKSLSKHTLIILSTHDFTASIKWADRIIILKEGEIYKDVSRNNNFDGKIIYKNNKIEINEPNKLQEQEVDSLLDFIRGNTDKKDIILNKYFKETIDIGSSFEDLQLNLDKNRKSIKNTAKLGYFLAKQQIGRTFITSILVTLCLTILGVSIDVAAYNEDSLTIYESSLRETNSIYLEKTNNKGNDATSNNISFSDEDLEIIDQMSDITFAKALHFNSFSIPINYYLEESKYYLSEFKGIIEFNEGLIKNLNFSLIGGEYPTNNNDILITRYMFEGYLNYGFYESTTKKIIKPEDINSTSIIGLEICENYKICGIIDTNFNSSKFEILKKGVEENSVTQYQATNSLSEMKNCSLHSYLYALNPSVVYNENKSEYDSNFDGYNRLITSAENLEKVKAVFSIYNNKILDNESVILVNHDLRYRLSSLITQFIVPTGYIILPIGILFLIIAYMILLNLFNALDEKKRRQIGILRSMGYSKTQTMMILLFEPFLISMISTILTCSFLSVILFLINLTIYNNLFIIALVLPYYLWIYFLIFIISLIVNFLAMLPSLIKENKRTIMDIIKGQ